MRRVQPGELDRGAAHLALPVVEELDVEPGFDLLHLQIHGQATDDRRFVHIEGKVGLRCLPRQSRHVVVKDERRVAQADPSELCQRMVLLARRIEQVGHQRVRGTVVRTGFALAAREPDLPIRIAHEGQAQAVQRDRGGRNDAAQQGCTAHAQRSRWHLRQRPALRVLDMDLSDLDFERVAPAGPDEDGVLELDAIGEILALQRFLDVGREESHRQRAAGEPPRRKAEEHCEHGEQGTEHLESDAGRRSHVDEPEAAASTAPLRPL